LRFCGEERLENAVNIFRIDARSRIFDRQQHTIGIVNRGFHAQEPWAT
jgi:hypothetical protein